MNDSIRLRGVLGELLDLEPDAIEPRTLLIDDLGLDSLGFIELAFAIEKEFDVDFPDVKASEETFSLTVPEALATIEGRPGGTTVFEFVKEETVRTVLLAANAAELAALLGVPVPAGVRADAPVALLRADELAWFGAGDGTAETSLVADALAETGSLRLVGAAVRDRLFENRSAATLAMALGGPVPDGIDPAVRMTTLHLVDLFRFLTVDAMARYVAHLRGARTATAAGDQARCGRP
jgi:acyl carrier protein